MTVRKLDGPDFESCLYKFLISEYVRNILSKDKEIVFTNKFQSVMFEMITITTKPYFSVVKKLVNQINS
jgi:hypothetical protein